jgi:hypothetical protein
MQYLVINNLGYIIFLLDPSNVQVRQCQETFTRECNVRYVNRVQEEVVQLCKNVLTRDCDKEGEKIECSIEYETGKVTQWLNAK